MGVELTSSSRTNSVASKTPETGRNAVKGGGGGVRIGNEHRLCVRIV
jgi:hypothetical protein